MKGAIQRTEIERTLFTATGFNTNLVQFLLPHYVTISNKHVCSLAWTDVHIKQFCVHKI